MIFFRVDLPDSPPCIGLKYVDKEMLDGKDPICEDADNQARSKIREALELEGVEDLETGCGYIAVADHGEEVAEKVGSKQLFSRCEEECRHIGQQWRH